MLTLVRLRATIQISAPIPSINLRKKEVRKGHKLLPIKSSPITTKLSHSKMSVDETTSPGDETLNKEQEQEQEAVVQYVVLRRDLIDSWPLGSIITQGCHASVAAIWEHKDDPTTLRYCSPPALDSMHKVTLEVKGEPQLVNLSEKLKANGILHKLWIEQPENYPTCLATKPYPKSIVSPFFHKLKLCK